MNQKRCAPQGFNIWQWVATEVRPPTSCKEVAAMSRFKKVTRIRLVVIVSVLALVVLPAGAQQQRTQKPVPQDDEPIKLNTTLVQVRPLC